MRRQMESGPPSALHSIERNVNVPLKFVFAAILFRYFNETVAPTLTASSAGVGGVAKPFEVPSVEGSMDTPARFKKDFQMMRRFERLRFSYVRATLKRLRKAERGGERSQWAIARMVAELTFVDRPVVWKYWSVNKLLMRSPSEGNWTHLKRLVVRKSIPEWYCRR